VQEHVDLGHEVSFLYRRERRVCGQAGR
jgi:hypothetical protein